MKKSPPVLEAAPDVLIGSAAALAKMKGMMGRVNSLNREWKKKEKAPDDFPNRIQVASHIPPAKMISTNNPALDRALGGGIFAGTIAQIYGAEAAGKSTTAAELCASVQAQGDIPLWYQTESNFPEEAFRLAGVDQRAMFYINAIGHGEGGLDLIRNVMMEGNVPNPNVGIIVVDSVAAMEPLAEVKSIDINGYGGSTVGRHAAMMSKILRAICGQGMLNCGCILLLINQERAQIGNSPMPNVVTGGNAMKYYPKMSIGLRAPKSELIKDTKDQVIGKTIHIMVAKNNTGSAMPLATGEYRIFFKKGMDKMTPVLDEAKDYGILPPISPGSTYIRVCTVNAAGDLIPGEKVNGAKQLITWGEENPDIIAVIAKKNDAIRTIIRATGARYLFLNGQYEDQETGLPANMVELLDVDVSTLAYVAPPVDESEEDADTEEDTEVTMGTVETEEDADMLAEMSAA